MCLYEMQIDRMIGKKIGTKIERYYLKAMVGFNKIIIFSKKKKKSINKF